MAEIIVSPLLQVVFDKLASPLLEEIANRLGLKKEVRKLQRTLYVIQAVLADAEEQQMSNRALRIWLTELKEVAYEMEDLLDEFSLEAMQSRNQGGFAEQVRSFLPSLVQEAAGCFDLLPRLKQIKETLEFLAEQKSSFNLRDANIGSRRRGRRQTGSLVVESEVFGREEDKSRIIDQLLSSNNATLGDISVVSIVGLGGLGKTTLAQLVYNNDMVATHFDLKIWVCVSDDFDVGKIMISIIESASKNKCDIFGMDVLQFRLQELLLGKRYLIVLDDVWNEDDSEWEKLMMSMRSGVEGSSIIVTTRSKKVALMMGSAYIHQLEGLTDNDCWALFKQRAFGNNEEDHQNLIPIGRQIVRKCGGVPLAAKTLGSLMRFKREERDWLVVQESDLWEVSHSENGILPALRLSYSHMPSHLKACFAYCSILPKNYIIKKEKLIQLWIAGGLIQSREGRKSLEFIGNEYFDDLVWMFFFQDIHKSDNGNIIECKIHDLIHDLARSIVGNEFSMLEHDNVTEDLFQTRHSSVVCNFSFYTIPELLYEATKLRTLILLLPKGDLGELPSRIFSSFRYLRVLDLSGSGIKKLQDSISSFIFLRYLDISNTHIEYLPENVCGLCNLQVLNLSGCYNLIELPGGMAKMYRLRHLILNGCERLTKMPAWIGKLQHLQTLSMFIVGREVGQHLNQLQNLNLGGELYIRQLENVRDAAYAMEADLAAKRNIQSLTLCWENDINGLNGNVANNDMLEEVLNHLQPHKYLKKLTIKGYQGIRLPRWMSVHKLPNISELSLINCRRCEYLPILGQLIFLKVLYLQGMDAVKNIGREFYGDVTGTLFPSLTELTLVDFPTLESWWSFNRKEEFPSLVKLTLIKCFRLQNLPCFPSLHHLELRSCNEMVLRSASNLTSLNILIIDDFAGQLVFLENLLKNNALLMCLGISSCPKLQSIPPSLGKLIKLKSLAIRWCEELHSLPQGLQNLSSLESLEIIECPSLISLPEDIQGLRSLRSLSIENCSNLKSLPIELQFLTALEHLTIMYCSNLASLPESFQHLSNLKSLSILNCPELKCLPEGLQYVTSLQNLEIRSCHGLVALPAWVAELTSLRSLALSDCPNLTSLPIGLQSLSSLQHLSILECTTLEERCKKDMGEDWPKISHVLHVYIGGSRDLASSSSH
ncbi:putative disease resistance protein RGA4 [Durio zibethinus]|uniref:Disease resistance protein RGA4 n=1 Tax=Durio zibethinus TaxID=66656 RepID=A0A6P6AUH1_DURZI|nr:putative disease resistance protein RGA4 [Durio zibethinus]